LVGYVVVLSSLLQKLLLYSGACGRDDGDEGVLGGGDGDSRDGREFGVGHGWFLVQAPQVYFFLNFFSL
jgi:hypothetical protein